MAMNLSSQSPSGSCYLEDLKKILDENGSDFSGVEDCEEECWVDFPPPDPSDNNHDQDEDPSDTLFEYYDGKNRFDQSDPKKLWQLLFTDELLEIIVKWTNLKIERSRKNISGPIKAEIDNTCLEELKALLGLLIYTSVFKSNGEDIECLYSTDGTGRDVFRAVMSMKRFKFLLGNLRFDNPDDREERRKSDPAALISEVMKLFVSNSQKAYTLGSCARTEEFYVGFRGKCPFIMFLPRNPVKYGLKIMCLTDARNNYVYNAYLHCGKRSDEISEEKNWKKLSKHQAVLRLSEPIFNTNMKVTADKSFSSDELTSELLKKGLTYVETAKKSGKKVPVASLECSIYSCSRITNCWPIALFYRLLDMSTVNAYILHKCSLQNPMTRIAFLKELAKELVRPLLLKRVRNQRIGQELRLTIKRILGVHAGPLDVQVGTKETTLNPKKTCRLCPPVKKRKTAYACMCCQIPICLQCSRKCCLNCAEEVDEE